MGPGVPPTVRSRVADWERWPWLWSAVCVMASATKMVVPARLDLTFELVRSGAGDPVQFQAFSFDEQGGKGRAGFGDALFLLVD